MFWECRRDSIGPGHMPSQQAASASFDQPPPPPHGTLVRDCYIPLVPWQIYNVSSRMRQWSRRYRPVESVWAHAPSEYPQ